MRHGPTAHNHLRLIQRLFNDSAARHVHAVEPVIAPLVDDFVRYAAPRPTDLVLDVGTGTGPIARRIAPYTRAVVGVDVAQQALIVARNEGVWLYTPPYVCADLHCLPFPTQHFTLITASFGLNATDPNRVLRELRRVIAPDGRIVIQEWGPVTKLDQVVSEILADYGVDDPPADLAALREWIAHDLANEGARWNDHLQDADDYAEWFNALGFEIEDARETAPVAIQISIDAFIATALAGTDRTEELRAMDSATRTACHATLRARLAAFADSSGQLIWEPVVIRAIGRAPGN